jgi:hypothetical protein
MTTTDIISQQASIIANKIIENQSTQHKAFEEVDIPLQVLEPLVLESSSLPLIELSQKSLPAVALKNEHLQDISLQAIVLSQLQSVLGVFNTIKDQYKIQSIKARRVRSASEDFHQDYVLEPQDNDFNITKSHGCSTAIISIAVYEGDPSTIANNATAVRRVQDHYKTAEQVSFVLGIGDQLLFIEKEDIEHARVSNGIDLFYQRNHDLRKVINLAILLENRSSQNTL